MVDLSMDAQHVPVVLSPSTSKMNGSVHHRHNLNLSILSTASSKLGGESSLIPSDFPPEIPQPTHKRTPSQSKFKGHHHIHEILGLLSLLSVMAVLLAFLAIVFFLKITPPIEFGANVVDVKKFLSPEECKIVYEVVLGLVVCTVSLDFTCFIVCIAQFLFATKLLKVSHGEERASKYLQCGSCSRGFAVCSLFISIPMFLTGVILYAFIHFHNISAIIAGSLLGSGILLSGIAIIHNAHLWQRELSRPVNVQNDRTETRSLNDSPRITNQNTSIVPQMELSTLV